MDVYVLLWGYADVEYEDVVAGVFASLEAAIDYISADFSKKDMIEIRHGEMWHFGGKLHPTYVLQKFEVKHKPNQVNIEEVAALPKDDYWIAAGFVDFL